MLTVNFCIISNQYFVILTTLELSRNEILIYVFNVMTSTAIKAPFVINAGSDGRLAVVDVASHDKVNLELRLIYS